jgi:hypothetical protein
MSNEQIEKEYVEAMQSGIYLYAETLLQFIKPSPPVADTEVSFADTEEKEDDNG